MKEFLKKYMTPEALADLEKAYNDANEGAKGLPVYISKARLDEVLGQKKTAEGKVTALETEKSTWESGLQGKIDEAVKTATETLKNEHAAALKAVQDGFAQSEAIYKAKGKNITAIKALIDPAKKLDEEIVRIQKSDPYLFEDDIPGGTGKEGGSGSGSEDQALAQMRAAVGI